jgi:hypothetical protein
MIYTVLVLHATVLRNVFSMGFVRLGSVGLG